MGQNAKVNDDRILVLNAGSSSLKFAVFDTDAGILRRGLHGQVDGIGSTPRLTIEDDAATGSARAPDSKAHAPPCKDHRDALALIEAALAGRGVRLDRLRGVGHRVVHGGTHFIKPLRVGPANLAALDTLRALAPLHNVFCLDGIRAVHAVASLVPQIACFDTAFHATQPDVAARLALPQSFHDEGYRRYGFHGLNYEYIVAELPRLSRQPLPARLLVLHLGNGASICAIKDGASVATTMGYSTLDGLVMGTRSGSIDPGVLIALLRDKAMTADDLENLLYRQSGLLGLSGATGDMRALLVSKDPASAEAVGHFCYWAARHAASLVTALGGLDALVFTGGIGAHAPAVRAAIVAHLSWLGVSLSDALNSRSASQISPAGTAISVWTIAASEERVIAQHVAEVLQ